MEDLDPALQRDDGCILCRDQPLDQCRSATAKNGGLEQFSEGRGAVTTNRGALATMRNVDDAGYDAKPPRHVANGAEHNYKRQSPRLDFGIPSIGLKPETILIKAEITSNPQPPFPDLGCF